MTVVFTNAALGGDDGDSNGVTAVRQLLATSLLSAATGNQITVTILSGTSNPAATQMFTNMFIGQATAGATGAAPSFTGNQVRVTWGGANFVSLGAGASATSDAVTLGETWDNTKRYIIAFDLGGTTGNSHESINALTGALFCTAGLSAGVNDASISTVSGFASATGNQLIKTLTVTGGDVLQSQIMM